MPAQLNPRVNVTGIGSHLPERIVDNDELSTMVSGFDASKSGDFGAWVDQVTHVHERRFSKPEERTVDLSVVRKAARRRLVAHWVEGDDGTLSESLRWLLALDQSPWQRDRDSLVVRMSTGLEGTEPADREAATQRLRRFYRTLRRPLERIGRSLDRTPPAT